MGIIDSSAETGRVADDSGYEAGLDDSCSLRRRYLRELLVFLFYVEVNICSFICYADIIENILSEEGDFCGINSVDF